MGAPQIRLKDDSTIHQFNELSIQTFQRPNLQAFTVPIPCDPIAAFHNITIQTDELYRIARVRPLGAAPCDGKPARAIGTLFARGVKSRGKRHAIYFFLHRHPESLTGPPDCPFRAIIRVTSRRLSGHRHQSHHPTHLSESSSSDSLSKPPSRT